MTSLVGSVIFAVIPLELTQSTFVTFSIRAGMLALAFFAMWLAAVVSRSEIGLEIASLLTILTMFIALPLSICDSNKSRRLFWAGYFATGIGFFLSSTIIDIPIDKTTNSITNALMRIPGADQVPEAELLQTAPVHYLSGNGGLTQHRMEGLITSTELFESINRAVPYLIVFCLASLGGIITFLVGNRTESVG